MTSQVATGQGWARSLDPQLGAVSSARGEGAWLHSEKSPVGRGSVGQPGKPMPALQYNA